MIAMLHFVFNKDWFLHVDSSSYAIAGVLSQPGDDGNLCPVNCVLQKLTAQERGWQVFDY
jgi:hypothetical protein